MHITIIILLSLLNSVVKKLPNTIRFFIFIHFLLKFTVVYKLQFTKMATTALSNKEVNYLVHPAACSWNLISKAADIWQTGTGSGTGCPMHPYWSQTC